MLCPEVWNFKEPASEFHTEKGLLDEKDNCGAVDNFHFSHIVSLTIPGAIDPRSLLEVLAVLKEDNTYYKVKDLDLSELVQDNFLQAFIKEGALSALSVGTHLDIDNCFCLTSNKKLILSLTKETFQTLGLVGKLSHFCKRNQFKYGAVGSVVVVLSPTILASINVYSEPQITLQKKLDILSDLLMSHVPFYLYDSMAVEVLTAIKGLLEKTKKGFFPHTSMNTFMTEMHVAVSLTEVVLNHRLRNIDFSLWPKIMRYVIYKNLVKMTGLEVLNLGSCTGGWRTSEHDKYILQGIAVMKNLRSLCLCFDCTDSVIQVIAENCPKLISLDVTSSRSVTDRSIPSLLKCTALRELQLYRTSITVTGFSEILVTLTELQDIGRFDEIGEVIRYIYENYPNSVCVNLKKVQTRDLSTENLRLLVDTFPNIESISLFHDEQFSDLTALEDLVNLKDLKLLSCNFYTDYLHRLIENKGCNLTSLHLEHVQELHLVSLSVLSKCCPQLKNLVLYNCDFTDHLNANTDDYSVRPFKQLERLFWVVDCARTHLELLLMNALNIKYVHLSSSTGINHNSIVKILKAGSFKKIEELRILYSIDMGLETIQLLLENCPNLRVMSELESWQGLTLEELRAFRRTIISCNFDLDVRPTLSYC